MKFFAIIFFVCGYVFATQLSFLRRPYELLNQTTLLTRHQQLSTDTSHASFEIGLIEFFLAEYYELSGRPHTANHYINLLADRCEALAANHFASIPADERAIAAYTCALADASEHSSFGFLSKRRKGVGYFTKTARANPTKDDERLYAEGMLFLMLPPGGGQDLAKATANFSFLERIHPNSLAPTYWLAATYESNGNITKAHELYKEIMNKNDIRAHLRFAKGVVTYDRFYTDGVVFGLSPGLFFDSSLGVGAYVSAIDERCFDTDRAFYATLLATTRGSFHGNLNYDDRELIEHYTASFKTSASYSDRNYYGLGFSSRDNVSALTEKTLSFGLGVRRPIIGATFISLGWQLETASIPTYTGNVFDPTVLPNGNSSDHMGAVATLGLDTRDSAYSPRSGTLLQILGYFPTKGLGSELSFQQWQIEARQFLRIFREYTLSFHLAAIHLSGDAPFSSYPTLSGSFDFPMVPRYRYTDRNLLSIHAEGQKTIWGPLSGLLFLGYAELSPEPIRLISEWGKWGGGIGIAYQLSRLKRSMARVDLGVFNSEANIKAEVGLQW